MELPKPAALPAVTVALGGRRLSRITDGYLATSIVYPSYQLAGYPREQITVNDHSRMPDYADKMTVQELANLVEFLQAHYQVREMTPHPVYY